MTRMVQHAQHLPLTDVQITEQALAPGGFFDIARLQNIGGPQMRGSMMEVKARMMPIADLRYRPVSETRAGKQELVDRIQAGASATVSFAVDGGI
jgi:hypothetical protein